MDNHPQTWTKLQPKYTQRLMKGYKYVATVPTLPAIATLPQASYTYWRLIYGPKKN